MSLTLDPSLWHDAPSLDDASLSARELNLEDFFEGRTVGKGQFQDVFGTVRRRFDVTIEGVWPEHSPAAWAAAGATWWLETQWDAVGQARPSLAVADRLRDGPPSL